MEAAAADKPAQRGLHHHHHPLHHHHHHHATASVGGSPGQQQPITAAAAATSPATTTGIPQLDVVRALHQTVISLRSALDSSREELRRHKEQQHQSQEPHQEPEQPDEVIKRLALENHVLRRRLLDRDYYSDAATSPPPTARTTKTSSSATPSPPRVHHQDNTAVLSQQRPSPEPSAMDPEPFVDSKPAVPETVTEEEEEEEEEEEAAAASTTDGQDTPEASEDQAARPAVEEPAKGLHSQGVSNESENESEELDDIELIFTTEDTCREAVGQEDLVSITDTDTWQQQQQIKHSTTPGEAQKPLLKIGQAKSADSADSTTVCNGGGSTEKTGSVDEAASSQGSSIDREESVDRFDENSSSRLNKMWSQCSVLVETDISKCGVLEEVDHITNARHAARRNTLAAPPTAYRPIIHREALAAGRRKSAAPLRPVLDRSSAGTSSGARRESGAQTDISALPAQWRSESYLAHKVAHTFTTLPSKFALPPGQASHNRLRLSDKTREARRVMLSDISFTSMVPELSRSADHLCQETGGQLPQPQCYGSRTGLRTPETNRRETWVRTSSTGGPPSPCECRLSTDLYPTRFMRGNSLSSIPSPGGPDCLGASRRHSWRPNAVASFDGWRAPAVLPGSHGIARATGEATGAICHLARPTWSSMPSSPTHVQPPSPALIAKLTGTQPRRARSRVTFQDCPMLIRGSLPNLRSDHMAENSGDSTESLIDEAEDYLRRSIDSMLTIPTDYCSRHSARRRRTRRHSEPDLFREWNPPRDARPYLPKIPRDLKLDHLVKVISPEGRILQGRVRYVGPVAGRDDVHVGVLLPTESGNSDGSFHGRRYFDCEPEHAVFVPFKKVVLAWCTT